MSLQRRKDTKAELDVRRLVHAHGWRYRVDAPLPISGVRRRADMLFTKRKLAVFIDGCFWHSCPDHATIPRSNRDWWMAKLAANQERDRDTDRRLRDAGWNVVRAWEHEVPLDVASAIEAALHASSSSSGASGA